MKQKDILFLLVSATFLAVVWIVFTIVHNSLASTVSTSLTQQIQPITGSFDNKTLQSLQKRQIVTPKVAFNGTNSFTPTPQPTIPPVALVSPTGINITPTVVIVSVTPTPTPKITTTPTP